MNRSACVKAGSLTATLSAEAAASGGEKLVGDGLRLLAPSSGRHTHTSLLNFLHYFRLRLHSHFARIRHGRWHDRMISLAVQCSSSAHVVIVLCSVMEEILVAFTLKVGCTIHGKKRLCGKYKWCWTSPIQAWQE